MSACTSSYATPAAVEPTTYTPPRAPTPVPRRPPYGLRLRTPRGGYITVDMSKANWAVLARIRCQPFF